MQIQGFTRQVAHLLADNLIGVYLHGSLAMRCFNPVVVSDIDVLVVTLEPMVRYHEARAGADCSCSPRVCHSP